MSFILPTLKAADRERYHRAVQALHTGELTINILRRTDNEVRALVQNGDGRQYGVTVNSSLVTCSCYDALYRASICKHIIATCIHYVQHPELTDNPIHLWWVDGTAALCGEKTPKRFWIRWSYNALNWPDICPTCVHAWLNPSQGKEVVL